MISTYLQHPAYNSFSGNTVVVTSNRFGHGDHHHSHPVRQVSQSGDQVQIHHHLPEIPKMASVKNPPALALKLAKWTGIISGVAAIPTILTFNPLALIPAGVVLAVSWFNLIRGHQQQMERKEALDQQVQVYNQSIHPLQNLNSEDLDQPTELLKTLTTLLAPDKGDKLSHHIEDHLWPKLETEQKKQLLTGLAGLVRNSLEHQSQNLVLDRSDIHLQISDILDKNKKLTGTDQIFHHLLSSPKALFTEVLKHDYEESFGLAPQSGSGGFQDLQHFVFEHGHWENETQRNSHPVFLPLVNELMVNRLLKDVPQQPLTEVPGERPKNPVIDCPDGTCARD
jgi:hypothetical protein